jgi:hypothetical protein
MALGIEEDLLGTDRRVARIRTHAVWAQLGAPIRFGSSVATGIFSGTPSLLPALQVADDGPTTVRDES